MAWQAIQHKPLLVVASWRALCLRASYELRASVSDGQDAFANYLSVTPIRDAAGRLSHFVGVQSDITELVNHKKAELAAKHAAVQARACMSLHCTATGVLACALDAHSGRLFCDT